MYSYAMQKRGEKRERKIRVNRTILRAAFRAARVKSVSYSWQGKMEAFLTLRCTYVEHSSLLRRKLNALTDTTAIPSVNAFSAAERLSRWTILLARGCTTAPPSRYKTTQWPKIDPLSLCQILVTASFFANFLRGTDSLRRTTTGEDNTSAVPFVRRSEPAGPILPNL